MSIIKSKFTDVTIQEECVFDFIFEHAKENLNKVFLVDGISNRTYTFAQTIGAIKKVAAGLHKIGIKKGDVLSIFSPNIPEYFILMHAAGLIGCPITPASPLFTDDELAQQLKDSKAKFLITVGPLLPIAKKAAEKAHINSKYFYVFGKPDQGAKAFASLLHNDGFIPPISIKPKEDIFIIPYSSGTSGLPKGVMLTHHNIVSNLTMAFSIEKNLDKNDIILGLLPMFHIYGFFVINGACRIGCKVIILPRFELVHFLEIIQSFKVTIAHLVPPIMLALAKHPIVSNYDLSSLREINSAAAPLSPEIEEAVEQRLKLKVRQGYGMTELSPSSHITPADKRKRGSVGILLPNLEAKVVNIDTEKLCGENEEGELRIKGPSVMKGYLNNEEATKNIMDEDGFMRTGDITKFDEDGYFYIVDRLKELIKYKGHQVAPAELEAILVNHPCILDAAVIPVPFAEVGELPKAYVVLKPGKKITAEEIQHYVQERVNPHKYLRGGVEFIDAIPKSPTGKILRRVLRQLNQKHLQSKL